MMVGRPRSKKEKTSHKKKRGFFQSLPDLSQNLIFVAFDLFGGQRTDFQKVPFFLAHWNHADCRNNVK